MRIFTGLIGIVVGLAIIRYREKIQTWTGAVGFAERIFGPGGTFTMLFLLGCVVVIGSVMHMTGVLEGLIPRLFGRFF